VIFPNVKDPSLSIVTAPKLPVAACKAPLKVALPSSSISKVSVETLPSSQISNTPIVAEPSLFKTMFSPIDI
jgi:hypothetical protein